MSCHSFLTCIQCQKRCKTVSGWSLQKEQFELLFSLNFFIQVVGRIIFMNHFKGNFLHFVYKQVCVYLFLPSMYYRLPIFLSLLPSLYYRLPIFLSLYFPLSPPSPDLPLFFPLCLFPSSIRMSSSLPRPRHVIWETEELVAYLHPQPWTPGRCILFTTIANWSRARFPKSILRLS